jgi:hypothetical protein
MLFTFSNVIANCRFQRFARCDKVQGLELAAARMTKVDLVGGLIRYSFEPRT